jgi:hypothetical protein
MKVTLYVVEKDESDRQGTVGYSVTLSTVAPSATGDGDELTIPNIAAADFNSLAIGQAADFIYTPPAPAA